MRILLPAIVAVVGLAAWAAAPNDDLHPTDIASRAGQNIAVTGTVSQVFTDPRSSTTFIDMGGTYPDNRFSGVIFSDAAANFPHVASLGGHRVKITGSVRLYRGKPEIVLTSPNQLQPQ